ncbi:MAG: sulfatase-like hydrolase/transferase [Verrucomicrobiaceae bacterium]|nr:sulfatase-like hydrolase/transferase [Verrucomicrobiaceae bacterium]
MKHLLTLFALLVFLCGQLASAAEKPNIIFILADDIGLPGFGCTGGIYKTPNIDALAKGGTLFDTCFAAPLCAPSRAMLMTGRYAFRTGVKDNGLGAQATPEKDGCVAQLMKQAGYTTAVAGKWRQLSYFTTKEDGAKWGFDEFLIWGAGQPEEGEGSERKAGKKKKRGPDGEKVKGSRYWDPDYNLNGKPLPDREGKYGPDVLQEFVLDFVTRHQSDPFFVYYPTPLIHSPIQRTPDSKTKSNEKQKGKGKGVPGLDSLYADNIAYLDKLVGQIVAKLDALHLREKTLIVFTGDNGSVPIGTVNGRSVDGRKSQTNEGGSRVPLIANWPGTTPAGVITHELRDFTDMLPTFAELAGTPLPTTRKIDGHSFAPQLHGQKGTPREWAYVQLREDRYVRTDKWKLTGKGDIFDMSDAPWKQVAVPADTDDAAVKSAREKLQHALDGLHDDSAVPAASGKGKKKRKTKA